VGRHIETGDANTKAFRVMEGCEENSTTENVLTLLRHVYSKRNFPENSEKDFPRKPSPNGDVANIDPIEVMHVKHATMAVIRTSGMR
jgi:hypothetical protein